MAGVLDGVRVLEMAAIGPVPFAGMMLSDMGADVVRIDRPPGKGPAPYLTPIDRGRRSLAVDLKKSAGKQVVLDLLEHSDIVLEGFRPGVMERLGLGPTECLTRNDKLVYGRMTGFGQTGPMSAHGGHDINYIALTGALDLIGDPDGPPLPPQNLLGDFGGGGMLLAVGVLGALHHATRTGQGQVVDAAMVDGVSALMAMHFGLLANNMLGSRGGSGLGGSAPYYCTYETGDGKWMAVGAIEENFYSSLLQGLGLNPAAVPDRGDHAQWPVLRELLANVFRSKTRTEWVEVFSTADACVTPVLALDEVDQYAAHIDRSVFEKVDGVLQPSPAPRFQITPGAIQSPPALSGHHTTQVLQERGFTSDSIQSLLAAGAVWCPA